MQNCAEEVHPKDWTKDAFATYGNKQNTFTYNKGPEILDYIFHKTNSMEKVASATSSFKLPIFKTGIALSRMIQARKEEKEYLEHCPNPWKIYSYLKKGTIIGEEEDKCRKFVVKKNKERKLSFPRSLDMKTRMTGMSLSDHEAIAASIYVWKK